MTNEEAIKQITTWLYAEPGWQPEQLVQALKLAVAALGAGGEDAKEHTTPMGKPLTMEQLRGMEGEKVLICRMKSTEPPEPGTVMKNGDIITDDGAIAYNELYLLTWVAFSYTPENIDREAWKCTLCETSKVISYQAWEDERYYPNGPSIRGGALYCPNCGRPRRPEEWAELEKKVRGSKNEMQI